MAVESYHNWCNPPRGIPAEKMAELKEKVLAEYADEGGWLGAADGPLFTEDQAAEIIDLGIDTTERKNGISEPANPACYRPGCQSTPTNKSNYPDSYGVQHACSEHATSLFSPMVSPPPRNVGIRLAQDFVEVVVIVVALYMIFGR